jgi:hypothetical protein
MLASHWPFGDMPRRIGLQRPPDLKLIENFTSISNGIGITRPLHVYEILRHPDKRGVDLISDVLPFGRLWYGEPNAVSNAIGYAMHRSRLHDAVIRVCDEAGNVIETREHAGDFKEW